MRDTTKIATVTVALMSTALLMTGACQQGGATPPVPVEKEAAVEAEMPPVDHEVRIVFAEGRWPPIETITVKRGQSVAFTAAGSQVWILIPDGRLQFVWGRGESCATEGFVAFHVDEGSAVIRVPDDYPDKGREFKYSVLAKDQEAWEYVHGMNPPPGMIIPPVQDP